MMLMMRLHVVFFFFFFELESMWFKPWNDDARKMDGRLTAGASWQQDRVWGQFGRGREG